MAAELSGVTVCELKRLKFAQLSVREKITIKRRGRCTPDIRIAQQGVSNNKKYIRTFNAEWYQRKSWLCGCAVKNALFCFPCLLFGGDATWAKDGFRNINKVKEKTEKHEKTKKHVDNMVSLTLLGTLSVKEKFCEAYKLTSHEHNVKVKKNREILSKIIECMFLCGNFETPLCGRDETDESANPGVFRGLVNVAGEMDADLRHHLETSAVFKGVSHAMQNEILDSLLQIYREEIKTEVGDASFVAVMIDDTTGVSEHTQLVLVVRYVLHGEVVERFWGFLDPEIQTADCQSKRILEQLDVILQGNRDKLIAHTFEGTNLMKGKQGGVETKIKAVYTNAHFMHCYAHHLDLIMRNAASVTRHARIFYANILAVPKFFARSRQRVSILKKHMLGASSTTCNFHIHTINRVYENLQAVKNCLAEIQSTSHTDRTVAAATGLLAHLNDANFNFWLDLFHQMMPHVELIHIEMQLRQNVFRVNEYIENFKTAILELKNSKYCEHPSRTLMAEAREVCDCLCVDITNRYSSTQHLIAAELLSKNCFAGFKKKHPIEEIVLTTEAYPMIDKEKFETELKVFYGRSDIHTYGKLGELLEFIGETNLGEVFSEITKLIKILLTVPMCTTEAGRCFSTLKRIQTFLSTAMYTKRLNALAVVAIEKKFLSCRPEMKEKIIDVFAQSETRRKDFMFR